MLGPDGLRKASENAIHFGKLHCRAAKNIFRFVQGNNGRVAHECIFDFRPFKETAASVSKMWPKRLIDLVFMLQPCPGRLRER